MATKKPKNNNGKASKTSTCIEQLGGIRCKVCREVLQTKFNFDRHFKKHTEESIAYTCLACDTEIAQYKQFIDHCYRHTLKARLECHICKKQHSKQRTLIDHLTKVHGVGQYRCPAPCKQIFYNLNDFKKHTFIHKTTKIQTCQLCQTALPDTEKCADHLDSHVEHTYCCPICGLQFYSKDEAPTHLQTHFEDEILNLHELNDLEVAHTPGNPLQISCGICKVVYKNKADFKLHYITTHDNTLIYTCTVCSKSFKKYDLFSNHCYNHLVKGRFKCDACEKTFPRLAILVIHMETVHGSEVNNEKPFECVECKQKFSTGKSLKAHLIYNHGIAYQICPIPTCGQMFDSPIALVYHQIEHSKGPQQRCTNCGLLFKNLFACYRHLDIHKLLKFTCPICERKYSEKYLIVKHIQHHYQTGMHICPECGRFYAKQSRLIEHVKSHRREFRCSYCDKKFSTKHHLNDHVNTHTKETPYKCLGCPRRFGTESSWRKHMHKLHNITSIKKAKMLKMNEIGDVGPEIDDEDVMSCDDDFNILDVDDNIVDESEEVSDIKALTETIGAELEIELQDNNSILDLDEIKHKHEPIDEDEDEEEEEEEEPPEKKEGPKFIDTSYETSHGNPIVYHTVYPTKIMSEFVPGTVMENVTFNDNDCQTDYEMILPYAVL